ncbi:MAG TPA: MBL fold metallo-hydrolase, partial [Puia sp.]|nr:MBL fold metallo-hydrolase [Puia sp.]
THLHFDHCGGSITREADKLVPAFKNAHYWSHSRHWKWATEPNDREKASFLKENILPIQESGRLRFVDQEYAADQKTGADCGGAGEPGRLRDVILPGISVRLAEGHTAAMMLPQLSYRGRTVVFMADLLPSMGHFPQPYVMAYDMFPLTTMQEKKAFLEDAAAGGYVLFFEHDPGTECCIPERTDKGVRPGKGFRLAEL